MRTSADSGVTWSKARFVNPERGIPSQPVACEFRTSQGDIVFVSDIPGSRSVLWISPDNGKTWKVSGSTIAGIHAGVVQLKDDRLMAFGRGNNIDGKMPRSISSDMGETWTYSASSFPPIGGGQRLVLMRLEEGPLFFASFTGSRKTPEYMSITDASGKDRLVTGLFAAISFDEGETWPHIRLVSDDGPGREVETMDRRPFIMGFRSAEPGGYLTACQSNDGLVHLISSQQHYAFNLAWLKTPPPTEPQ